MNNTEVRSSLNDKLPITKSTRSILRKLKNWREVKSKLAIKYRQQQRLIDDIHAKLKLGDISHISLMFFQLTSVTDEIRAHMYTELIRSNNRIKELQSNSYFAVYLTDTTSVQKKVNSEFTEEGWELLNIPIGSSFYDVGIILGKTIELIQIKYIKIVKVHDQYISIYDSPSDMYVLDGVQPVIENIYSLMQDACLFVPRFNIADNGLSMQFLFRVLKER